MIVYVCILSELICLSHVNKQLTCTYLILAGSTVSHPVGFFDCLLVNIPFLCLFLVCLFNAIVTL